MTLAEIIEEGENAERAYREAKAFSSAEIGAGDWCHRFYVAHGPTLLAVCRAAVEVLADHDERVRLYPEDHAQPHKVKVMDALRDAALSRARETEDGAVREAAAAVEDDLGHALWHIEEGSRDEAANRVRAVQAALLSALSTPAPAPSAHAMRRCEQPEVKK